MSSKKSKEFPEGSIHKVNDGDIEILKYNNSRSILVRFKETGYERLARAGDIRSMEVKDRLKPSVHGVGFLGDGEFGVRSRFYNVWADMISRCYCQKALKKRPSYIGCRVCDEWHNFQVFNKWCEENHPKDGIYYELDKDINSEFKPGKVYSPEFCKFVTPQENMQESKAKTHKLINPNGDIVEIYNLNKFCKENNLNNGCMNQLSLGKMEKHKGWRMVQ